MSVGVWQCPDPLSPSSTSAGLWHHPPQGVGGSWCIQVRAGAGAALLLTLQCSSNAELLAGDIDSMVQLLSFKQRSHCRAGSGLCPERMAGPGARVRARCCACCLCQGWDGARGPFTCAEDAQLSQDTQPEGTGMPSPCKGSAQQNLLPRGCYFHCCLLTPPPIFDPLAV